MIARWPVGPVCQSCYIRSRANPTACTRCGQVRVLIAAAEDGKDDLPAVYGVCANSQFTYPRRRCGSGEEPYGRGHCVRCEARDRLTTAFASADGQLTADAAKIVDAFIASRRSRSVLEWLSRPGGAANILRRLIADGAPITHDALDRADQRQVWSLRRSLIEIGLLPARNDSLERLTPFLHGVVNGLKGEPRQVVSTYGTWWVLRRARRHLERTGRFTISQKRSAQRRLLAAAAFLKWLGDESIALAALTQGDVDRWLDADDFHRADVADFLRWARRRRLISNVTVHRRQAAEPSITLSEDTRWRLLNRCLKENDIPVDVRAAGALVLLYGLQLSRVVELTDSHLRRRRLVDGEETIVGLSVTLTGSDIAVPPSLAAILSRLPVRGPHPRTRPLIGGDTASWLFPGFTAAGHLNAATMSKHMKTYGIPARTARNAALIALAGELPISLVSDLFDISISTAMNWARRAGKDWNAYLAASHWERSATSTHP